MSGNLERLNPKVFWKRNACVSLILFFLLWEWIRPLIELSHMTDLYIVQPFLIAIGGFILLDYIRCPQWLGWPVKMLICLSIIGYFFHHSLVIDMLWWNQYIEITVQDGMNLIRGDYGLSAENRTLLFLFGWALMISAVQSLMISRHSSGFFIAATLLYLAILQLWAGLDTTMGIVRTLGLGMVLMSLLNLPRIERMYQVSADSMTWPKAWISTSLIIVSISLIAGVYFSKNAEQEIRPVQWGKLQAVEWFSDVALQSQPAFTPESASSGYGNDDSRLGGSIVLDEEIVFMAKTDELTYWRGEAKSHYDGKGWTEPLKDFIIPTLTETADEVTYSIGDHPSDRTLDFFEQEVLMSKANTSDALLFTGGLAADFQGVVSGSGHLVASKDILFDQKSGSYKLNSNEDVSYYKVKIFRDHQMRVQETSASLEPYLQLPEELPNRVKQLTENIVGTTNDHAKRAALIESYLKSNYTYNLEKPKYPPGDQDFVDHFLFDQGYGYCDHFSTTMVVMLRTLGVPARWVKGYTPGEANPNHSTELELASDETGRLKHSVIVRNLNAHSWVEVYIPEKGWIAFEPTPGISMELSAQVMALDESAEDQNLWDKIQNIDIWILIMTGSVIVLSILALRGLNKEWYLRRKLNVVYKSGDRSDAMIRLFEGIWLKIFHRFGPIQPSQTIREYIEELNVVDLSQREALLKFAGMYESVRYNNLQREWINKQAILKVWKEI